MFRPLPLSAALAAALTFASPAIAASELAEELKQLARAQQGTPSSALSSISYNDAVYLLDELNYSHYRHLATAMREGRLELPTAIRQALELKAPRLNQRGSGE